MIPPSAHEDRPTILIVGDDSPRRALLGSYVGATYQVLDVAPQGALGLLDAHPVELVILDLGPQEQTGLEICRRIIARDTAALLPVLVIAPSFEPKSRRAGREAGAAEVLVHPVDPRELQLCLQTLLALRTREQQLRAQLAHREALDGMKDDLVTLIAHDLRNPLAGLSVLLQALHRDAEAAELRRDLTAALMATQRVRDTIDDMLAVRRLEEAKLPVHRAEVGLHEVARGAITTLHAVATTRRVTLDVQLDEVWIVADAKLLQRALENLLDNSIRYSREGSAVSVRVSRREEVASVEVSDRGPGLTEEVRATVLATLSGASGRASSGLGLQLVTLAAEAHGGRVEVGDRDGGGAVFRVLLPSASART